MIKKVFYISFLGKEVTKEKKYRPEYLSDDERLYVGEGYDYSFHIRFKYKISIWDFPIKDTPLQKEEYSLLLVNPTKTITVTSDKEVASTVFVTLDNEGYYGFCNLVLHYTSIASDKEIWNFKVLSRHFTDNEEKERHESEKDNLLDLLDEVMQS